GVATPTVRGWPFAYRDTTTSSAPTDGATLSINAIQAFAIPLPRPEDTKSPDTSPSVRPIQYVRPLKDRPAYGVRKDTASVTLAGKTPWTSAPTIAGIAATLTKKLSCAFKS